jgi:uncharacterized protein (TIGR01777 family)
MKVAITGASGFVASHLKEEFKNFVEIRRDDSQEEILAKLRDVDVVFNLAGAPIIKRWSESYKKVLLSSRVETTKKLVKAVNASEVKHFISASAVGAYPDDGAYDESYTEYANDFLGGVIKEWEVEANKCSKATTIIRFGIILGKDGGALTQMLTPFKMGVGGTIGDGKMVMSWIAIDDLVGIYAYIVKHKLTGLFNATAPNPVTNYEFTKALGKALHRFTIFPIPLFVLKIIFGDGASVLTGSKKIYPKAIMDAGFEFKYKTIEKAFIALSL